MTLESLYDLLKKVEFNLFTDTRKIIPGGIFFALKGENFNGNLFANDALAAGASYAVVDEVLEPKEGLIKVDSVLQTLQQLANLHRRRMNARVIGIGGSNGKTTTKELMVSVLATKYKVHSTQGNFNNHIGVPLTLLTLKAEHEISVIEMGTNRRGDIEELCRIAEPDMGLITNIGKEHLEGFGSVEGVAAAESELFDYLLKNKGLAFINQDDHWLSNMAKRFNTFIPYSIHDLKYSNLVYTPNVCYTFGGQTIHSNLPGVHNFQNMVAVTAVAEYLGLNAHQIADGIEQYLPKNNRSQMIVTDKGNTVFLDAYNANPSSVEMAVHVLSKMPAPRLALVGDMFELGDHEAAEHRAIQSLIANSDIEEAVLVGVAFASVTQNNNKIKTFAEKKDALNYVKGLNLSGRSVLIKGSRGMKMEEFLPLV